MDQKWDRIKQFGTGDACPSTNSLLDSAEIMYSGDRKRSVKSNRHHDEPAHHQSAQSAQVNQSTMSSLEQSIYTAMDEQRFAFESLIKSNSQKLNHMADDLFAELRNCRDLREEMERRLANKRASNGPPSIESVQAARKQYLLDLQKDLRGKEASLKRDIESSRSAIEMLVLVGGGNSEYMDAKVQKLIDIRQDSIDRVDKELYGIEGQLEEIMRELASLVPSCSRRPSRTEQAIANGHVQGMVKHPNGQAF